MSSSRPKVLFVTYHYLQGVGGGIFASRAYINAFASLFSENGEVSLLYPESETRKIEGIDSRVKRIPVYNRSSKIVKAFDIVLGNVHWYEKILPKLLKEEKFDIVVFDNSRSSFRMIDLAHNNGAKVITIHHNCELEFNRDNGIKILRPVVLYWTRKYERDAIIKSDLSLTLTPEDKQLLYKHYIKDGDRQPNVKVIGVFEYTNNEEASLVNNRSKGISSFVITGNLSYSQSKDSIIPWIKNYYPILKKLLPECQLTIAGKDPDKNLESICAEYGINLIPSPNDMAPILKNADCYICPTNLGGGLKLRIMDGLKNGLPVITHEVSARGYSEFEKAGMLFSYNDKDTFEDAVRRISTLKTTPEEIRAKYDEIFSLRAGIFRMDNILKFLNI